MHILETVLYQMCLLQIFSPSLCLVFSLAHYGIPRAEVFNFNEVQLTSYFLADHPNNKLQSTYGWPSMDQGSTSLSVSLSKRVELNSILKKKIVPAMAIWSGGKAAATSQKKRKRMSKLTWR